MNGVMMDGACVVRDGPFRQENKGYLRKAIKNVNSYTQLSYESELRKIFPDTARSGFFVQTA